jgi:hypothetical protein
MYKSECEKILNRIEPVTMIKVQGKYVSLLEWIYQETERSKFKEVTICNNELKGG